MLNRRIWIGIVVTGAAVLILVFTGPRAETETKAPESSASTVSAGEPAPKPAPAPAAPAPHAPDTPRTGLPKLGTNAKSRLWVRASFGKKRDQFGKLQSEGETYPPQGFVPTADGRLLVLDTAKQRLVRYGQDGRLEAIIPLPEPMTIPADVAVAQDGTIAVIDYSDSTVLLDSQGNKKAEELPAFSGFVSGLYAAGNDFYVNTDGLSSALLGNTKGVADTKATAVHQEQDGSIAGHVAPDGSTVLRMNRDNAATDDWSVTASRGSPPQQVFTHYYRFPGVSGIPFLQADAADRIYMVVNSQTKLLLVCLGGKSGNPVGMVELPFTGGRGGEQRRVCNVAPKGGLVYAEITESEVSYKWFDCHP